MGKFIFVTCSILIALTAWGWKSLPKYPEGVEYVNHRYFQDSLVRFAWKIGVVLDKSGYQCSPLIVKKIYSLGSVLSQGSKDDVAISERQIGETNVITYTPMNTKLPLPIVIYFHGGGWLFGSSAMYSPVTSWLSSQAKVIVISVDYGLSPETTYKRQIDECINVAMNVIMDPSKFNGASDAVFIGGDSAGANLAASVLVALTKAKQSVRGALLLSPSLQAVNLSLPSYNLYRPFFPISPEYLLAQRANVHVTPNIIYAIRNGLHIKSETLKKLNRDLLDVSKLTQFNLNDTVSVDTLLPALDVSAHTKALVQVGQMALDPIAYPLLAENSILKDFPPMFVQVCEYDMLRDDGLLFVNRLRELNVRTSLSYLKRSLHNEPIHSFFLPASASAKKGLDDILKFINIRNNKL